MEKQFNNEYDHWGAKKKVMNNISKRKKRPETLQLKEKGQEIAKPGNLRFKFDKKFNRKVWVPRRPVKRGRDEVAAINLELLSKNIENNRWWWKFFLFNEPKTSSGTEQKITNTPEQNKNESEPISIAEEMEVAKSSSKFLIMELRNYHIAKKTIHYIQVNHVIEKQKLNSTKAEETLKKADFNFKIALKSLIHKTPVTISRSEITTTEDIC